MACVLMCCLSPLLWISESVTNSGAPPRKKAREEGEEEHTLRRRRGGEEEEVKDETHMKTVVFVSLQVSMSHT